MTKIALLSPYTGDNLGDGAIQEAVIANVRARIPGVQIVGITTDPQKTNRCHGIPCVPMTAVYLPGYSTTLRKDRGYGETSNGSLSRFVATAKEHVKKQGFLWRCLKVPYSVYKGVVVGIPMVCGEVFHIIRSYQFLKGFQCLIVSGGGQLDDYWGGAMGHPYSLFKWAMLARLTHTKFIILSVGRSALSNWGSRAFVRQALKLASYRSYRDERSKDSLKSFPFTRTDNVYPDLAFSYTPGGSSSTKTGPSQECLDSQPKSIIGISPIAYLSTHGWPVTNLPIYEQYIGALVAFIKALIEQGHAIRLFGTDSPDYLAIEDIMEHFHGTPMASCISQPTIKTVEDLLHFLHTVDYVVASRLHGTILSHLMNRPVLAISYDTKVDVHMEEMGQSSYCLDIHKVTGEMLSKSFALLVDHAEFVKDSLQKTTQEYGARLSRQYDFVLQKA